jgi:hypothetical protein
MRRKKIVCLFVARSKVKNYIKLDAGVSRLGD